MRLRLRKPVVLVAVFLLIAAHALAQTTPKTPTPSSPPAPAAPAPQRQGQPINIRVDTSISETGGNGSPVKKTVTAVAGDGFDASVRETTSPGQFGPTSLNVDASPTILPNGKIRLRVTLQYVAGQGPTSDAR